MREPNAKSLTAELFTDWKQWAEAAGEFIGSQRRFSDLLITRGIEKWRNSVGVRGFQGHRPQEPARRPLTPLTRTTDAHENHPSDAADALPRNSLYACACARLMEMFRQTVSAASDREQERTEHHEHDDPGPRPGHHHRLGAARPRRQHHQRHRELQAAALRRRRHALPALQALAHRDSSSRLRRHRRACTSRKCAATLGVDAAHAYGGFMATSPRGASTTRSRTRACRSARSRSTPPAKATPARTR